MAWKTLVVAPHPDDEVLGCGGTLLRRKAEGAELAWMIVTSIDEKTGWATEQVRQRESEMATVAEMIGFDEVFNLRLPAARLDVMPAKDVVGMFADTYDLFKPNEVLLPSGSDVHSDHRLVFDAGATCMKWFRFPSVRRALSYETLSETDFNLRRDAYFHPNYFIDITEFLERKLEVMAVYESELGVFPFPRSVESVRALAAFRGSTSGFVAAEGFQLLREVQ